MQTFEVIKNRHSYRGKYKSTPVPREDLTKILEAGLLAPSGCNKQTTSFIAVDEPELLKKLHSLIQPPIGETAPAMICILTQRICAYRDKCFAIQDYSAAIQNMLLEIVELGYQSCWIEGHITDEDKIGYQMAQVLGVPDGYELVCFLPVGIAESEVKAPPKKAFEERAWFNGYKNKMQYDIQLFDSKYIPQIVERVKPMWSVPSWSEEFKQFDVEFIVRSTIYENDLSFQLVDAGELLSVALAVTKSEKNDVEQWVLENSKKLSDQEKISAKMSFDYIKYMDSKVFALMNDDDVKLSLFVSCKKGFGSIIFEHLWKQLKIKGFKNMYLWTDCDCNWQWYLQHGFTLIEESEYEPFSDENGPYKTYVFKKSF